MFRRSYFEMQHWLELWYLHLLNLCPRYNTWLSLKVFWFTVWAECLSSFFLSTCKGLLGSLGVTSLILDLLSPPRMFVSPTQILSSWIVPPQLVVGEHLYPLVDEQVPTLLQCPILGRVLFPSPLLIVNACDCGSPGSSTAVAWSYG